MPDTQGMVSAEKPQTESDPETHSPESQSVVIRDPHGRWIKGHAPKSPGRPKRSETVAHFLQAAPRKRNKQIAESILTNASDDSKYARIVLEYQTGLPNRADGGTSDNPVVNALLAALGNALSQPTQEAIEGEVREL